ncbi:hypothetical protein BCU86_22920 [Vibrio lentus]|nr:hypothetical protein BCU86_22920 [Vibrio lentus]
MRLVKALYVVLLPVVIPCKGYINTYLREVNKWLDAQHHQEDIVQPPPQLTARHVVDAIVVMEVEIIVHTQPHLILRLALAAEQATLRKKE